MDILYMQKVLRMLNYDPGPIDGKPGPRTIAALIQFQADKGIKPDGVPGPITEKVFINAVKEVQANLARNSIDPGPIDGLFGLKTRTALVRFQRIKGLIADGVVGPRTKGAFAGITVAPPPPVNVAPNGKNVVLDAGHGGYDSGAVGNGLYEKAITLLITLKTRDILKLKGFNVKLTREIDLAPNDYTEINADLNERVRISEQFMGSNGLFVSIHLNSIGGNPDVNGTETLVYGLGGEAEKAARLIQSEIVRVAGVNDRGIKAQNVLVLRKTSCPAVLTESVFISSQAEGGRLGNTGFINSLAESHAEGICKYFGV